MYSTLSDLGIDFSALVKTATDSYGSIEAARAARRAAGAPTYIQQVAAPSAPVGPAPRAMSAGTKVVLALAALGALLGAGVLIRRKVRRNPPRMRRVRRARRARRARR